MRLVIQRVSEAGVSISGRETASIKEGFLILAGFGSMDGMDLPRTPEYQRILDRVCNLRVFSDERGKMNRSLLDIDGEVLLVSQFTLYADCAKGRRPSFHNAADPGTAKELFEHLAEDLRLMLPEKIQCGVFGADMAVRMVNNGPVTILLDTEQSPHSI